LSTEIKLGTVFGVILGLFDPIATAAYWPDRRGCQTPSWWGYLNMVCGSSWWPCRGRYELSVSIEQEHAPAMGRDPLELRTPERLPMLAGPRLPLTPVRFSADVLKEGKHFVQCAGRGKP